MKKGLLFVAVIFGIVLSGCVSNKTETIVDGVVTVEAGKYVDYNFSVPSQASISGNFTASGGSGNDIRVLILDETSYINWINGHNVSTYYDSGQITTGSITASVPKGNYYLVYSNTFSTLSAKNVKTKVDVTYTA
jgi:Ca2+-binding RTX toxin-like protein